MMFVFQHQQNDLWPDNGETSHYGVRQQHVQHELQPLDGKTTHYGVQRRYDEIQEYLMRDDMPQNELQYAQPERVFVWHATK